MYHRTYIYKCVRISESYSCGTYKTSNHVSIKMKDVIFHLKLLRELSLKVSLKWEMFLNIFFLFLIYQLMNLFRMLSWERICQVLFYLYYSVIYYQPCIRQWFFLITSCHIKFISKNLKNNNIQLFTVNPLHIGVLFLAKKARTHRMCHHDHLC